MVSQQQQIWGTFHYSECDHPLADVAVTSRRLFDVPGLLPLDASRQFTHRQLWQSLDGQSVRLSGYERFQAAQDLNDYERLISGLDDDSVVQVQAPGFCDGRISWDFLAVPTAMIAFSNNAHSLVAEPSIDDDAYAQQIQAFQDAFYEGEVVGHNMDFIHHSPIRGIVVFDKPGYDILVGHGIGRLKQTMLRGSIIGLQAPWPNGAWATLSLLGSGRSSDGQVNETLINAFLPPVWKYDSRFDALVDEGFVPVCTASGASGLLVWPSGI